MIKIIRYLLYPISLIYGLVVKIRNCFYDKGILHSVHFDLPVICVGNLSIGGSGKTPMVEYLTELLRNQYKVAILSRGYKRKTGGIFIADDKASPEQIGDEPMQFYTKYYPSVTIAVSKYRVPGIPAILSYKSDTRVIILDDAFQHRAIRAGMNILLTTQQNLYCDDMMLPVGNLRDEKKSSRRADIIVVTKCKPDLDEEDRRLIMNRIKPAAHQSVFFAGLTYGVPYHLYNKSEIPAVEIKNVLLVTGIASPGYIYDYLKDHYRRVEQIAFGDHHAFEDRDIAKILDRYMTLAEDGAVIITTEKDAVKLIQFRNILNTVPVFVLPVKHSFLFGQAADFDRFIVSFVRDFGK